MAVVEQEEAAAVEVEAEVEAVVEQEEAAAVEVEAEVAAAEAARH